MRVAIVTNVDNGKGLQKDCELLSARLRELACAVTPVHFQKASTPHSGAFDLAIFLEVAPDRFFDCAQRRWLIPNPEWWEPKARIDPFDLVLCKTADAERIFSCRPDACGRVAFLGFEAQDKIGKPRHEEPGLRFLHIAGGSTMKGTRAVIDAWQRHRLPHPLTILANIALPAIPKGGPINVISGHVPDAMVTELQRSCRVHLQPSEYEGFGHVIHEGLSCGAVVVTTDSPPMAHTDGIARVVAPFETYAMKSATCARVDGDAVAEVVEDVAAAPPEWWSDVSVYARQAFEAQRDAFRSRLATFIGEARA